MNKRNVAGQAGSGPLMSNVRPHKMHHAFSLVLLVATAAAGAEPGGFAGRWNVDLRTPSERAQHAECGIASFELAQDGDRIYGSHSMATVGCGRVNEGGPETVKGVVVNGVAMLVVTSGRNGAIVMGTATQSKDRLHWQYREEVRPGEPEGDSPLILNSAILVRNRTPR
jgi:hypothetical protein